MYAVIATAGLPHASGLLTTGDVVVIMFVVGSMALGFWSGFLWQFVRIAGVVASLYVSLLYYPALAASLGTNVPQQMKQAVAAGAVFLAALLACYLLTYFLRHLIDAITPELPDRVLGAVFGMFRGAVLVGVGAFLLMRFLPLGDPVRESVEDSTGAVAAATCVRVFLYALPERYSSVTEPGGARAESNGPAVPCFVPRPEFSGPKPALPRTPASGKNEVTL